MRKIFCDECGKEILGGSRVFARVKYKETVETTTPRGKTKIKTITRWADLCSHECFQKFVKKVEAI